MFNSFAQASARSRHRPPASRRLAPRVRAAIWLTAIAALVLCSGGSGAAVAQQNSASAALRSDRLSADPDAHDFPELDAPVFVDEVPHGTPLACADGPEAADCFFEPSPRSGILQQLLHSTTRLVADSGELAMTELEFSTTLGFPFPSREAPVLVTPAFGLDLLDTDGLDLPDELYNARAEFRHLRPLSSRLTADLAVEPGVYGNTETSARELRVQGRAVGIYQWRSRAQAVLGVAYLDREDVPLLPVAGLLWAPHEGLQADLLFPRPRIALRVFGDVQSTWWAHIRGEFGGGSWGVTRAGGADDIATIRDVRLLAGLERRAAGISFQLEGGYAFSRHLEYASGVGDTSLDGAGLLRAAIWY